MDAYEKWLCDKLLELNPDTDTEVFVTYIIGILESESDEEEQKESLAEFLTSLIETGCEEASLDIFKKWTEFQKHKENEASNTTKIDTAEKLAEIFEKQKLEVSKVKTKTAAQKATKEAILNQYSMVPSGSETDDSDEEIAPAPTKGGKHITNVDDFLDTFKNTNSEDVAAKERLKRDVAKVEADKKKEKDKQDRDFQKTKQADRKEAEKKRTQKGERRR
ncbi:coiled-coil domain-containing protein 43 [Patella vulgata]|uniref:coiled-coil domain-containing protein 43 n=1 Tax=Patella vulgata TaxID=6465 RepID=UPI0021801B39|nr:coiled-coil domain-containing protein 43 [Patella vulgata]